MSKMRNAHRRKVLPELWSATQEEKAETTLNGQSVSTATQESVKKPKKKFLHGER